MRKIFQTAKGCPISQLYLEVGVAPARFEIQKLRLLYFKYILEQSEDSLLSKFFHLQLNEPTKGDWVSKCLQDLDELKILETLDEIRKMTHTSFLSLIKSKLKENALKYLLEKRKSKGKEIIYSHLEMAEYLLPTNEKLTVEEKRNLFGIRNRMVEISSNFSKSEVKPHVYVGKQKV